MIQPIKFLYKTTNKIEMLHERPLRLFIKFIIGRLVVSLIIIIRLEYAFRLQVKYMQVQN